MRRGDWASPGTADTLEWGRGVSEKEVHGAGTNTPHYPPEFKREAVELYRSSGKKKSIPKMAEELGISSESLRRWITGTARDRRRRA